MQNVASLFTTSTDPAAAFEQLASVAGNHESLAAACKALTPRALESALKYAPATSKPLLLQAAALNAAPTVKVLLEARASPDLADSTGATACFIAVQAEAHETLAVLIAAGADVQRPRNSGATPVYIAAQQGAQRSLMTLLQAHASPATCKEGGFAPLSIACLRGRTECAELLLTARADCNHAYTIADRFTPLMLAAHLGNTSLCETLLRHGATLRAHDASGHTPREIAIKAGHALVASLLVAKEGEEVREGEAMAQEATVVELKQMHALPEMAISSQCVEALSLQLVSFSEQQNLFADASHLQSSASLIAHSLLPAHRLASQLSGLEDEATELEASTEYTRAALDEAQRRVRAALRGAPTDEAVQDAIAERDVARSQYVDALGAMQTNYEARQKHGARYAEALAEAADAASMSDAPVAPDAATAPAGAATATADESGSPALPAAIATAVPILRRVNTQLGEASRATRRAMEELMAAMARELQLISEVRVPLAEARGACDAAARHASRALIRDSPREDLKHVDLLLAQVCGRCAHHAPLAYPDPRPRLLHLNRLPPTVPTLLATGARAAGWDGACPSAPRGIAAGCADVCGHRERRARSRRSHR